MNAVLAINGDYYGARDAGYVVRNGQLLRSQSQSADQEDLVIYKDGSFGILFHQRRRHHGPTVSRQRRDASLVIWPSVD